MDCWQDFCAKEIERCHLEYVGGNRLMLFEAIRRCAQYRMLIPDWIRRELEPGLRRYGTGEVKEFGAAFGVVRKKGEHLPSIHHKSRFAWDAYTMVRDRHRAGEGIGDKLFSEVGAALGMSKNKVSEYYYLVREYIAKIT